MTEKHYPVDPAGLADMHDHVPAKPCVRRLDHSDGSMTWCTQPDKHGGQCSGPLPRVIESDDLGPNAAKRRRWP